MTASQPRSSVTPAVDELDAWILAHPFTPELVATVARPSNPDLGAYCVNRDLFERMRALEGRTGQFSALTDPAGWSPEARRLRRRVTTNMVAWNVARWEHEAGRRSSPAFAILDLDADRPRLAKRRRHLTHEQRAKQRHRYKGALADALEAFGRAHLIVNPRERIRRPRWVDHKPDCRSGYGEGARTCNRCQVIPLPPALLWRRAGGRRRKRDHLTVPEWLIDRAQAARSCQDVVGLQDTTAGCGAVMVVPQSCHVRAEPDCEAARQTKVVAKYRLAVEALDPDRTGFLTLTKLNPKRDELALGIVQLKAAEERLKRRALWKGGRCRDRRKCRRPWDPAMPGWRIPHEPITASMTTLETTYNDRARSWHPHLHLIVEGWLDQGELSDAWLAITGDSSIVYIESVKRHAADRHQGDVEASLRELLKYAAKPSPAFLNAKDPAVVAELLVALRGRHLTSTSGRLYGLGLEDELDEERDLVLVWPDDEGAERPYHAPRICPHHNGEAAWRVLRGFLPRRDCIPAPDASRPGRSILTWRPPVSAGDGLPA